VRMLSQGKLVHNDLVEARLPRLITKFAVAPGASAPGLTELAAGS